MSDYTLALGKGVGMLTMKLALTHMATVRTRMMTSTYKVKEDHGIGGPVAAVMRLLLVAYGPSFENTDRLLSVVSNAYENEPFWFSAALMLGLSGKATEADINLIWAFVAFRFIHAFCYLLGVQPWRALSYVGGLSITGFTAARLIL